MEIIYPNNFYQDWKLFILKKFICSVNKNSPCNLILSHQVRQFLSFRRFWQHSTFFVRKATFASALSPSIFWKHNLFFFFNSISDIKKLYPNERFKPQSVRGLETYQTVTLRSKTLPPFFFFNIKIRVWWNTQEIK